MKSKHIIATLALFLFPVITFAAGKTLSDIIDLVIYYLNMVLVLFMGVAVVIFIYHVIKYFILPNENRSEAGSYVLYSVIGFFVILSFWGIVNVLQTTFGLQNENNRPASWASFSNLFPGGSTNTRTQGTFRSELRGTGTFNPPSDYEIQGGIRQAEDYDAFKKIDSAINLES